VIGLTQQLAHASGELGEVYDKLKKSHPGWNDVLHRASKVPGSIVKPV
jgi:hypothetical protein